MSINKFDKLLEPIRKYADKTRGLIPISKNQSYYFEAARNSLSEIVAILAKIPTDKVFELKKAHQPTKDLYERKINDAIKCIDDPTYGVLKNINQIFSDREHSADIYRTMRIVQDRLLCLKRQLRLATRPVRRFLISWKPGILLVVVGLMVGIGILVYRTHNVGKPLHEAVNRQLQTDYKAVQNTFEKTSDGGLLGRIVNILKQLKEIEQLAPTVIISFGTLWTAITTGKAISRKSE